MSEYPKGSDWNKWDLHVHSPASYGFIGSWEQFEDQLKVADCQVIGINDYFSVAGYKRISEKIKDGTLDIGNKKLLPVVEFRMRDVLKNRHSTQSGTNINFHIIFDDSIPIAKIETFLKSLHVEDAQIADRYDDLEFLRESARVYFEKDVLDPLRNNPDFADKFLVFLPYDEYGGIGDIEPNSDDWIKKKFIKKSDILGSSNRKQIEFFLWKSPPARSGGDKFTAAQFAEWFGNKKPCIKGSDSHNHSYPLGQLMDSNSQPIDKHCWIKAEKTFEGLKQIVFDPESRVSIGAKPPVGPTNVIEKIAFNIPADAKITLRQNDGTETDASFCFAGFKQNFELSSYLNCFVGGRGSGKSTILNFLGQHSSDTNSSLTFWEKIQPTFEVSDKGIFTFDGVQLFEFIGQSEVESFATNREAFTAAIYERANLLSDGLLKENEIKTGALIKRISHFRETVEKIKVLKDEETAKIRERKTLESSIKITESHEYADIALKITTKSNDKQELESWRTTVEELRDSVEALVDQHFDPLDEEDDDIGFSLEDQGLDEYQIAFMEAEQNVRQALNALVTTRFVQLQSQETKLLRDIEQLEKDLSKLLRKSGISEENLLQAKNAPQRIVKVDDEISRIVKRFAEQEKELVKYQDVLHETEQAKLAYENEINQSIKPLLQTLENQAKENDKKDVKSIGLSYFFDSDQAWKNIAEETYAYFAREYKDSERPDSVKTYIVDNKIAFSKDQRDIETLLSAEQKKPGYVKFLRGVFSENSNFKIFQIIRDAHLNDVSRYRRIQVLYDEKDIEHASFGQKCTAVIVILLLFGNYPLIIDEPEAHLDSSLIANYLVPLIKNKKANRQILFATHNANFVINGDAEKIFILRNDSGITEVLETTIENLANREELLKLEGGREAFRSRGVKLHI